MFVKVIWYATYKNPQTERLYECRDYRKTFYPEDGPEAGPGHIVIDISAMPPEHPVPTTIVLEEDHVAEVYIMNNEGQTVDAWNWNLDKKPSSGIQVGPADPEIYITP